jgi:hypothetical protein
MLHTVPEYFLIRDQQKEKQALKICQHSYKEREHLRGNILLDERQEKKLLPQKLCLN